ncbi:hypothetical protein CHL76_11655 [Marinococcus halophilus]|uniref:Uncharacterized protein n=1 Tax=Marinococcus halophilus TaxID=1371 RepID=A0A510YCI4_MARHA|nr:hypothetical protein CHL76_11655 [Marinococcus halophilus]GEK60341.1 hypothetical protein MHA01_32460 [Marinococcus halophilus]
MTKKSTSHVVFVLKASEGEGASCERTKRQDLVDMKEEVLQLNGRGATIIFLWKALTLKTPKVNAKILWIVKLFHIESKIINV